jgi:methionyl aminopeptidase
MREADQLVADVLATLASMVRPGVTTRDLDTHAERMIRDAGDRPAFLGYHGFPASTCISVDSEIIHGIPGDRVLKEGELVSIDVGVEHKGYFGDAALTVPCGQVDATRQQLLDVTDRALAAGVAAAVAGNHIVDVSRAVQEVAEEAGFSIVREFVGHGIGTRMHEEPQIPNYVTSQRGPRLRDGMVLAIEPMVNAGTADVKVLDDGWTAVTADGRPSAHFEHSVVVRAEKPEILSATPKRVWGVPRG